MNIESPPNRQFHFGDRCSWAYFKNATLLDCSEHIENNVTKLMNYLKSKQVAKIEFAYFCEEQENEFLDLLSQNNLTIIQHRSIKHNYTIRV